MYERFSRKYKSDPGEIAHADIDILIRIGLENRIDFFERFGGLSFNNGIYRVHIVSNIEFWTKMVDYAYPNFSGSAICFGYDWLGNQFGLDKKSGKIWLFELGTGKVLRIPCTFDQFHESELIDNDEAALESDFFKEWIDSGNLAPNTMECVGYKIPLFLGGKDEVSNLELVDMDVYWELTGQLITKTESVPEGTRIDVGKED